MRGDVEGCLSCTGQFLQLFLSMLPTPKLDVAIHSIREKFAIALREQLAVSGFPSQNMHAAQSMDFVTAHCNFAATRNTSRSHSLIPVSFNANTVLLNKLP